MFSSSSKKPFGSRSGPSVAAKPTAEVQEKKLTAPPAKAPAAEAASVKPRTVLAKKLASKPAEAATSQTTKATKKVAKAKTKKKKSDNSKNLMTPDSLIRAMRTKMQDRSGRDDVIMADDTERLFIGIPLPSLAMRYLLGIDIWPLGRLARIVGLQEACKTSFGLEVMRWHLVQQGIGKYIEAEVKDAPTLRGGILGPELAKRVFWSQANSQEEWQEELTRTLQDAQEVVGEDGGYYPYCFMVDSFNGVGAEESINAVAESGTGSRGYPVEALQLKRYLSGIAPMWRKYPFTVLGTNHQIPSISSQGHGPPGKNTPGGYSPKFMQATEIEMTSLADLTRAGSGGKRLQMKTTKNSNAESRRKITVDFIWRSDIDPDTGDIVQRHYFDWYSASIDCLLAQKAVASKWNAIQDIIKLVPHSGRRVHSSALGIPKAKPVKYHEAGRMLEERPDLLRQLYRILSINPCNVFVPGVEPYRKAVKKITRALDVQSHEAYRNYAMLDLNIGDDLDLKAKKSRRQAPDDDDEEG